MVVKQVWLENQFQYDGGTRSARFGNGFAIDSTFGYYMKKVVGISQKPITANFTFTAIATYLKELFPEFLEHNPFEEPEYYEFPYTHITLDHMIFVYQCDDRLDMLRYADTKEMSFADFANWSVNHVLSYNSEVNDDIYTLSSIKNFWSLIRNKKYKKRSKNFDF